MSERLVTTLTPKLFASYGHLQVAFYDRIYNDKPKVYIFVRNLDDKYSVVDRAAGDRRVMDEELNYLFAPEIKLYQRAYDKYLAAKNGSDSEIDYKSEYEVAAKKVAELEASALKKENIDENTFAASYGIVKKPKDQK